MLAGPPVSCNGLVEQIGPLLDAVAVGLAFTVATVLADEVHPLASVTVKV